MKHIPAIALCLFLASCQSSTEVISLTEWSFSKDNENWESVSVPHSYNALDGHSEAYYRGPASYRTSIRLNSSQAKREAVMLFEGAAQKAVVSANGTELMTHKGGYTAFFVPMDLHSGVNTVSVICDNTEDINLAPVSSDFNKNGGLHNPVCLLILGDVHLSAGRFGQQRFYVCTPEVTRERAIVEYNSAIRNATAKPSKARVEYILRDAAGRITGKKIQNYTLAPGEERNIDSFIEVSNPHLWHGVIDPYLYTAEICVRCRGICTDKVQSQVGLRFYELTKDEGFKLNGEPYPLRGTSIHQDTDGKASALSAEDYEADYAFVQELGCNFVRLAHYPHNNIAFDICDRLGLIVQTEIPWVNVCGVNAQPEYFSNLHEQMAEMVSNLYNHPSIVFWGMWNELAGWGNNDRFQGKLDEDKVVSVTESLYDLAKSMDPYRYVGLTDCQLLGEKGYSGLKTDYVSENRYNGWYYGTFDGLTPDMCGVHDKGFAVNISEYGAGVNPFCHTWNPADINNSDNARHVEEWGNLFHESHLQQIEAMPFLNFTSIWILFDFPVAARQEGYMDSSDGCSYTENSERKYMNDKGLVTRDRKTRKDVFYLYKAKWNTREETVHIAGKRLECVPEGFDYTVKVYSNAGSLSLYRGDELLQTLNCSGENTGVIWQFSPVRISAPAETFRVVSGTGVQDCMTIRSL